MKRVTMRDIAKRAKVSHVTVSLALRNRNDISLSTRERIQKLAKKMGYVPDPALGRLNAYRRGNTSPLTHSVIAWVNLWEQPEDFYRNPTYLQYREGADNQASELGFRIEEFPMAASELTVPRFAKILQSRGINGILLPPIRDEKPFQLKMPWESFSVVRIGHSLSTVPTHIVTNSQFATAFDATLICIQRGLGSIGNYFDSKEENTTVSHFIGGYLAALHRHKMESEVPPLISSIRNIQKDRAIFLDWFFKYKPDVVFTQQKLVYDWLIKAGLKIPDDVRLIHLALPIISDINFTGMHQNSKLIGAQAVDYLAGLIRNGKRGLPKYPVELDIRSEWQEGDTC